MNLTFETGVPVLTVFLQGLISFFSPCVLPLIPLYIGYLSGGARSVGENGEIVYRRGKVMLNTLFFVLGVSFAFFALGLGFTAAGQFFSGNRVLFARIGGVIVILFGLYQLGLFGSSRTLSRERRLPFRLDKLAMNPFVALLLGFTFSFAWTPCVGPTLASVLLMAASSKSAMAGFSLIGIYTLGFVLPFLAMGLFTGTLLDFFKKHQKVVRYTVKISGVLMILMGVMMVTGWMNHFTGYLNSLTSSQEPPVSSPLPEASPSNQAVPSVSPDTAPSGQASPSASPDPDDNGADAAPDFTLVDQNGEEHTLSAYKGKVVFLNFWTTWCGYCVEEMPDIQDLYEEYGRNEEDVVFLAVASPAGDENKQSADNATEEEIKAFIEEKGYTFPVVMDRTGKVLEDYGVGASFPITFLIGMDGKVFGYAPGAMSKDMMRDAVLQTWEATKPE